MGLRKHDPKSIFSNYENITPNINGIYMVTNKFNGERYVGTSLDCFKRGLTHYKQLFRNKHKIIPMQEDFKYCGMKYFDFRIIYEYKEEDQNMIHVPERMLIRLLKSEYNICTYKCNVSFHDSDMFSRFERIALSILSETSKINISNSQTVIKLIY
jgi:group I intron endonuclease